MTDTTTKRRAPTWDDVKEAYAEGLYTPAPAEDDAGALASFWGATVGADWHPDTPANQVAEHEWRTGTPDVGRDVMRETGSIYRKIGPSTANGIGRFSLRTRWKYIDPPPTTTSEDNS